MEKTRNLHWPIMAALCMLLGTSSAKEVTVALHSLPALSTVQSKASATAVVDVAHATVNVTDVQGLPALPAGATYEVLLVHNTPGPGHSIALDPGPDGDDIVDTWPVDLRGW